MKLRIKFSKNGPVKFIGHLDVMRYFQKAIRRAGIDVTYSKGFSPHQVMSFAAPLGVGLESDGEYMDIEVNSALSSKDVMDKMNAVMHEGICVLSVKQLSDTAKNAMASVAASRYFITMREGYEVNLNFTEAIQSFLGQEQILIKKQTKKSELEIDLKPGIYEMKAVDGGMELFVDSSSSGNLKPATIICELFRQNNIPWNDFMIQIRRMDTYTSVGTPEEMKFISMDEVGETF